MLKRLLPAIAFLVVATASATSAKVFLRVTQAEIPGTQISGITDTVISNGPEAGSLVTAALGKGYRVFLECPLAEANATAEAAERQNVTGVVVRIDDPEDPASVQALGGLRAGHPKLQVLALNPRGKEPQMKGRLVVDRDGVLQVSSPTSLPWVDSNLALNRFAQTFHPNERPTYTFHWDLSDPLRKKLGPTSEDYSLAIAEASAFGSDLILELPDDLLAGLAHGEPTAVALWTRVTPVLAFEIKKPASPEFALANIAVIAENYRTAYEGINLLARHNIPFRVLRPNDASLDQLKKFNMAITFVSLSAETEKSVADFAKSGGTAVLVNAKGTYSWQKAPPARKDAKATEYKIGSGQIIEMQGPVIDPESFARDIRRLMGAQKATLSLWNSLTAVGTGSRDAAGNVTVNLVNYALEAEPVQVRVQGSYQEIRLEAPEIACCMTLSANEHDGYTEFVVPALFITARIHLKPR